MLLVGLLLAAGAALLGAGGAVARSSHLSVLSLEPGGRQARSHDSEGSEGSKPVTHNVFDSCSLTWSVVPGPAAGTVDPELRAVTAVSANDVWAVGYQDGQTLVEHWDGNLWTVV